MSTHEPRWRRAPARVDLSADEVHVWRALGPTPPDRLAELSDHLDAGERARAARFLVDHARDTFILARGSLREILARTLGATPSALAFEYGSHGKPSLAGEPELEFNVTHSADLVLIAVARGRPVGIDTEKVRTNFELEQLARRFFSEHEGTRLTTECPDEDRPESFFRCWTRKEAYLKLKGAGLSFPLSRFEVSLLPGEPPALLHTEIEEDRPEEFFVADVAAEEGYLAALITPRPAPRLAYWELTGQD